MKNDNLQSSKRSSAATSCGDAPASNVILIREQKSGAGTKATSLANYGLPVALNPRGLYEPWRLFDADVGQFVGNALAGMGNPIAFAGKSAGFREFNDDFQQAKILVQQTAKSLFYKVLCDSEERPTRLKTMTIASNHVGCGEICGVEKVPGPASIPAGHSACGEACGFEKEVPGG